MNWQVFTQLSTLQVQIHWVSAVLAFFLGLVIFSLPKGTGLHKTLGWGYAAAMALTAFSAIFIRNPGGGLPTVNGFSPIHLFIPLTTFGIGGALIAVRAGRVTSHRRAMIVTFVGALFIAGAFTFMPGRHMHSLFFGDPERIQRAVDAGFKK